MDLAMMAAAGVLMALSGQHLWSQWRKRQRSRLIEAQLRKLQKAAELEVAGRLWGQGFEALARRQLPPAPSPTSSAPQDGPSISGVKPQRSSSASLTATGGPLATTGAAWADSNLTLSGSDTRGRVWTIGPTPSPTLAWPMPSTSTAGVGGPGRVSQDDGKREWDYPLWFPGGNHDATCNEGRTPWYCGECNGDVWPDEAL